MIAAAAAAWLSVAVVAGRRLIDQAKAGIARLATVGGA